MGEAALAVTREVQRSEGALGGVLTLPRGSTDVLREMALCDLSLGDINEEVTLLSVRHSLWRYWE